LGTAFTYQGYLEKPAGTPVDGVSCDFRFGLWDAAGPGGDEKGDSPQTVSAVDVDNGIFVVTIDFGPTAINGTARWLEIEVQCPGDAGFTLLTPRVALTPGAYALRASNGVGPPSAVNVDAVNGDVGIGTNTPMAKLHVSGDARVEGTVYTDYVSSNSPLSLQTAGTTRVYLDDATGAVGIGTAGPFLAGYETGLKLLGVRLPSERYLLSCAADPGSAEIYCFGGSTGAGEFDQIVKFDQAAGIVEVQSAVLPTPRSGLSCAASQLTGMIYCFGGYKDTPPFYYDEALEYDPATGSLSVLPAPLPSPRAELSCATDTASGKIYCFGGSTSAVPYVLNQIVEFDPDTQMITVKPSVLPTARTALACTSGPPGVLYCFGGNRPSLGTSDEILQYVPSTGALSVLPDTLPAARYSHACAWSASAQKAFCFGGLGSGPQDDVYQFDPDVGAHVFAAVLPHPTQSLACATSAAGPTYCFGGAQSSTVYDDIVELRAGPFVTLLQVGNPGDGSGALANVWGLFSSRAFKDDIQPLTGDEYDDLLAKLVATNVVRYRHVDDRRHVKHLGVLAEDAPREIVTPGGKAVSLGDFDAVLLAAIKAQQVQLDAKERRLAGLEQANDVLTRENADLAERLARIEAVLRTKGASPD
jgi:hypothetical protein